MSGDTIVESASIHQVNNPEGDVRREVVVLRSSDDKYTVKIHDTYVDVTEAEASTLYQLAVGRPIYEIVGTTPNMSSSETQEG